jgi:translation elongation factor Ts
MAVTAAMIKELRNITGAGMSACKEVLVEADGNMEMAEKLLREKGLLAAAKKAGRIASEGLVDIFIADDSKRGAIVEVNSETDFVAKNDKFKIYVREVATFACNSNAKTLDEFLDEKWNNSNLTVKEELSQKIAVIGENLNIRRFERFETTGCLISYIHAGGKVGVMLELSCQKNPKIEELGKNICMQIAAMNPKFISRSDVSQEFIDKEKEILTQQAMNEGKPANIAEKMVAGRLNKELKEFCLLEQEYVKDNNLSIKQYIENVEKEIGQEISVLRFVRFETGEGLEKKDENFAQEVSKAMKN